MTVPAGTSTLGVPTGRAGRSGAPRSQLAGFMTGAGLTSASGWPSTPLMKTRLNVPLLCFLAYLLVVHSGRFGIGQIALGAGLLFLPMLRGGIRVPRPLVWFGGFVVWSAATMLLSPFQSAATSAVIELSKIWLIALLAANVARTPGQLRFLMIAWLGLYAVFPVRGTLFNFLAGINEFGRYQWNFIFENSNDLAAFTLLPFGLAIGLLYAERTHWLRLSAMIGIAALAFVIVITQSRGGILALGTFGLLMILRQKRKLRSLMIAGAAGILVVAVAPGKVWNRLAGLAALAGGVENVRQVDREQSAASRWAIWRVGFHVFREFPVTGGGYGAFKYLYLRYQGEVPGIPITARGMRDAHGTYTKLLAENGVPGLVLFVGFIVASQRHARRASKAIRETNPAMHGLLIALTTGQIAYLQAVIFASHLHLPFLYVYTMIMWTVADMYGRPGAQTSALGAAPANQPADTPARRMPRHRGGLAADVRAWPTPGAPAAGR